MNTTSNVKHWIHAMHEESVKIGHEFSHLLHEKSFWGMVAILAFLATLITLVVLFGDFSTMQNYPYMLP